MPHPDFPRLRRVARGVFTGACFGAAFVASALLIGPRLPFPDVPAAAAKHAWFAEHGRRYDTLFLGSSRIEVQIVPAVFNQRTAELGHPLAAFNAGISAMTPPEDAFFFDHLARCPHDPLRWVFIELQPVWLEPDRARRDGGRLAYWHDWERSVVLWQCFVPEWQRALSRVGQKKQRGRPWADRFAKLAKPLGQAWVHAGLSLEHAVHLGAAVPPLARAVLRAPGPAPTEGDGWVKTPEVIHGADLADYQRTYAERLASPQVAKPGSPAGAFALRRLLEKVARLGATPVLLVPPTTSPWRFEPPPDIRQSCLILDFSDPRAYPELFALENRLDGTHLSAAGALVFTRLVAEHFAAARGALR